MKKKFYIKKRGFTLIELLAVIVILAIILLITMPIVLNVISEARKGAFESSARGLIKTAENEYMKNALSGNNETKTYVFEDYEQTEGDLEFSGKEPRNGYIHVTTDGNVAAVLEDGTWLVKKGLDEKDITIEVLSGQDIETTFNTILGYDFDGLVFGENPELINGVDFFDGTAEAGMLVFKTEGEYTFNAVETGYVYAFLVGGGGSGAVHNNWHGTYPGGGGSGYTKAYNSILIEQDQLITIIVGAGGEAVYNSAQGSGSEANTGTNGNAGGLSQFFSSEYQALGGMGGDHLGSGGLGGSAGGNAHAPGRSDGEGGQLTTTRGWEYPAEYLYAGSGGGGTWNGPAPGGINGGGAGSGRDWNQNCVTSCDAIPNTGGGGGGRSTYYNLGYSGSGGSGIVIVRWGGYNKKYNPIDNSVEEYTLYDNFIYAINSSVAFSDIESPGKGMIVFKEAGVHQIILETNKVVDVFLVGGGGSGAVYNNWYGTYPGGGGSGYTKTFTNISLSKDQVVGIYVGAGGEAIYNPAQGSSQITGTNGAPGEFSQFLSSDYRANGGSGGDRLGTGGAGGSAGGNVASPGHSDGGGGQLTTTRGWELATDFLYAGGGGGGTWNTDASGGLGGGGAGSGRNWNRYCATSCDAIPNTGGGGGGRSTYQNLGYSGSGGTGIVIIRWGGYNKNYNPITNEVW